MWTLVTAQTIFLFLSDCTDTHNITSCLFREGPILSICKLTSTCTVRTGHSYIEESTQLRRERKILWHLLCYVLLYYCTIGLHTHTFTSALVLLLGQASVFGRTFRLCTCALPACLPNSLTGQCYSNVRCLLCVCTYRT